MPATQELENLTYHVDLTHHVRKILPEPKALTHLKTNPQAGVVEFNWHSRHFVVTPALRVFELKESKHLLITGASMLIQAALQTKDRNTKIIEAVVDTLRTVEENMRTRQERGFALLAEVKKTLSRCRGSPENTLSLCDLRILIVDDHAQARRFIRQMIVPLATEVFESSDGLGSVDLCSRLRPDFVTMDLMMTSGLRQNIRSISSGSQSLSGSSQALIEVSQQVSSTAEETSAQAGSVASPAEQVSHNLQPVATATEQMSASVGEISNVFGTSNCVLNI